MCLAFESGKELSTVCAARNRVLITASRPQSRPLAALASSIALEISWHENVFTSLAQILDFRTFQELTWDRFDELRTERQARRAAVALRQANHVLQNN